jgi:tetratricopeptide (TPR) repeat protein
MNRSDFLNMIGSRSPVNRSMLGEVYELIDMFPYFQSAHMLLLKGLKDNEDIKFEKQLRNSAIHIADREVLYYLLRTEKLQEPVTENSKQNIESVISQAKDYPADTPDTEQTVIETAKNSDLLISELEKDNGRQINEEPDEIDSGVASHSVLVSGNNENEESDRVILIMDENSQGEEENVFFMDPGFSVPAEADLLELDTEVNGKGYYEKETKSEEHPADTGIKETRKQLQNELIDKFIISNPRIEPVRDKSSHPVEDLSIPHVVEKESFVTETLARIYVNQGYYSKAIDIYEKLSLKFPEKSSYFAAQIEKVKEYIK